jgi:hypothetical protein
MSCDDPFITRSFPLPSLPAVAQVSCYLISPSLHVSDRRGKPVLARIWHAASSGRTFPLATDQFVLHSFLLPRPDREADNHAFLMRDPVVVVSRGIDSAPSSS